MDDHARRGGARVQAHTGFFPFTVREMVLMGRAAQVALFDSPSGADEERASNALEAMGLSHLVRAGHSAGSLFPRSSADHTKKPRGPRAAGLRESEWSSVYRSRVLLFTRKCRVPAERTLLRTSTTWSIRSCSVFPSFVVSR